MDMRLNDKPYMNHPKGDASPKRYTFKSFPWRVIVGAIAGGIVGLAIGSEVAPAVGSYLIKPSPLILDPSAIIVSLALMVACGLIGAVCGALVAHTAKRS